MAKDKAVEEDKATDEDKKVLSEAEVDALMDNVEDGDIDDPEEDSGEVKPYDFSGREKSLFGQIPGLSVVNEKSSLELTSLLADNFKLPIEVELCEPRIISLEEAYLSVSEGAVINLVRFNPLPGISLIEAPGDLISCITHHYFGGSEGELGEQTTARTVTPSELRINERVVKAVFSAIQKGWQEVVQFAPQIVSVETSMQFVQPSSKDANAVCIGYQVTIGEFSSVINWILPYANLETLRQNLGGLIEGSNEPESDANWGNLIRASLMDVALTSSAIFTEIEVSLGEVSQWQVGSIVPIKIPEQVSLNVENIPMFKAEYGSFESNKAIKLISEYH